MPLIKCRECGKEISSEAEKCPNCGVNNPSGKKKVPYGLITVVLALLIIVGFIIYNKGFNKGQKEAKHPSTHEPAYKRDEPAKPQIYQDDFKDKIINMHDSGMSVNEISKATGIRRDEIKKILKEHE